MGYRSEVCGVLAVDDRDPPKFKELIDKIQTVGEVFLREIDAGEERITAIGWGDGVFMFHVEDWNWYPDDFAVKAWDAIWEMASAMEGVSGMFIRVGEDLEDNVVEYFGRDCYRLEDIARISRRIEVDRRIMGHKTTEGVWL